MDVLHPEGIMQIVLFIIPKAIIRVKGKRE